jgi:hypothetical protein
VGCGGEAFAFVWRAFCGQEAIGAATVVPRKAELLEEAANN